MGTAILPPLELQQLHERFERDGYCVCRGLFAQEEVAELLGHFMDLHAAGPIPGVFAPVPLTDSGGDILRAYPRMLHPHRVSAVARRYLLHPRVLGVLWELFGEEPWAAQSMLYFKPPSARGQALHQDDYYLKTSPGRCIAAWTALDPADEANGGMLIVPGTQGIPILCPHEADPRLSFTREEVDVPAGLQPEAVRLQPGDVLFFNGSVIHGSYPNSSADRFRRAFICHYVSRSTQHIGRHYHPLLRPDGSELRVAESTWGGPCGSEFTASPDAPPQG